LHRNGLGSDYENCYVDFEKVKEEKRKLFDDTYENDDNVPFLKLMST